MRSVTALVERRDLPQLNIGNAASSCDDTGSIVRVVVYALT
jgi:hypothetical protein